MSVLTRAEFLDSEAGTRAKTELQHMVNSSVFETRDSYDPTIGSKQSFLDRHINYLVKHPYINPAAYLSNLRIMTRKTR